MCIYIYIYIYIYTLCFASKDLGSENLGFRNGTLERRYSRIMLSPPRNMKPYLGHCGL